MMTALVFSVVISLTSLIMVSVGVLGRCRSVVMASFMGNSVSEDIVAVVCERD